MVHEVRDSSFSVQKAMRFGLHLLRGWDAVRHLAGWHFLPPAPGAGLEDMDVCLQIVQAGLESQHAPFPKLSLREMGEQAHFCARWASFGFPIFSPTESLTAAFLLTDSGAVSSEALKLPFDSFVIELPWPQTPFLIETLEGEPVGVRWIHVHRTNLLASAEDKEKVRVAGLTHLQLRSANLARAEVLIIRLVSDVGLSVFEAIKVPEEGRPLSAWFGKGYRDREEAQDPQEGHVAYAEFKTARRDRIAIRGARSFLANLCLYVASLKQEGRWESKRLIACNGKKKDEPVPTRWVLGREIKLGSELRQAARSYAERGEKRAVWTLAARYVVRGHWRNQACGPQHSERRQVWIAPHWKGPAAAPGLVRPMVVS